MQTNVVESVFNDPKVADPFLSHYDTLRGRVRTEVSRRHLVDVVPLHESRFNILDVGAGDGRDASWLASLGHDVIAIDPAEYMVHRTQVRAQEVSRSATGSLSAHLGDVGSLSSDFDDSSFDLILSHGVLMYHDDPKWFLKEHIRLLRPGGFLSILTKNASSLAFRAASEGHLDEAIRLLNDSDSMGHLGVATHAHSVQDIADYAACAGGTLRSWAGVRIFTDYGPLAGGSVDEDRAVELELLSSRLDPQRRIAALIHVIIQRGVDLSPLPS